MPDPATVGQVLAVIKLAQYTASGIGVNPVRVLFPSWIAKREGAAKIVDAETSAQAIAIEAEAQSKAMKTIAEAQIEAQQSLQPAGLSIETDVDFSERVEQSVRFRAAKRQANVETIVKTAAAELGEKAAPDEEPDHDWTARFFEYGQDVSTEEMQVLWAKVLAGEVERPGSTSLQTLSVLRDLDRNTAELFARLCSLSITYVTGGTHIHDSRVVAVNGYANGNGLTDYGIAYRDLNRLQEHGLLTTDYNSYMDYSPFPRNLHSVTQAAPDMPITASMQLLRNVLFIEYAGSSWFLKKLDHEPVAGEIRINGVAMSNAGKELSRIVQAAPNPAYSAALASHLREKGLILVCLDDGVALE